MPGAEATRSRTRSGGVDDKPYREPVNPDPGSDKPRQTTSLGNGMRIVAGVRDVTNPQPPAAWRRKRSELPKPKPKYI
jgi:hypothetical protein